MSIAETLEKNPLEMSDEEIMEMGTPPEVSVEESQEQEQERTSEEVTPANLFNTEEKEGDTDDEDPDAEGTELDAGEGQETDPEDKEDSEATGEKETEGTNEASNDNEESDEPGEVEGEDTPKDTEISADKAAILAPFRANGKDMQVHSIEDARTLMQMGANYNKKMAGLKPNLKLLKMLENNKLLDEAKLSFLIDIDKKDPEAIKKLLKDSNINIDELDMEVEPEYTQKTYNVSDKEVDLDGVLSDISNTETFDKTVDIITNKWDNSSKGVLLNNPDLVAVINDHVDRGIYDQINTVIESERMLGRLAGVSDIDAYQQIGEKMQANNSFVTLPGKEVTTPDPKPKSVKKIDPKLKSRKRAASSTKQAPAKSTTEGINPLDLSDEEFEKAAAKMKL